MPKVIDLIYRVKDEASGSIHNVQSNIVSLKGTMTELQSSINLAKEVFSMLDKGLEATAGKFVEQSIAAGDLAAKLGVTTEEASSLIEMAGDLDVEVGTLQKAFQKMSKEGIDPSIEGLINVKAQLDAAAGPADRLALAQKLMGKSGAELIPILSNLTDEQLRKYIEGMSDARITTEAEYKESLKARESIKEFGHVIDDAELSVGKWLTEGLLPLVDVYHELPIVIREAYVEFLQWESQLPWATQALKDLAKQEQATWDLTKESDKWYAEHKGFYNFYTRGAGAVANATEELKSYSEEQVLQKAAEAILANDPTMALYWMHQYDLIHKTRLELEAYINLLLRNTIPYVNPGPSDNPKPPPVTGEGYHHKNWRLQHPSGVDSEGKGNPYDYNYASGGLLNLKGWNLVGDPGPNEELIGPGGVVIPHNLTKMLLDSGFMNFTPHMGIGEGSQSGARVPIYYSPVTDKEKERYAPVTEEPVSEKTSKIADQKQVNNMAAAIAKILGPEVGQSNQTNLVKEVKKLTIEVKRMTDNLPVTIRDAVERR